MQDYIVKLESFEGPMDLLMHLIDVNKIDIFDIPIAALTQQYMDYLAAMREFDMEIASEFLVMAATLLRIKARTMLPKPPKEEPEAEDPRLELVAQILEYSRFKQASSMLGAMAQREERYVARSPMELPVRRLPPENLSLDLLLEAFAMVLEVKEELSIPNALVQPEEYHVRDKMQDIIVLLSRADGRLMFSEAFRSGTRSELVATFLALLELVKRHMVTVRQQRVFSEIYILAREDAGDLDEANEADSDT